MTFDQTSQRFVCKLTNGVLLEAMASKIFRWGGGGVIRPSLACRNDVCVHVYICTQGVDERIGLSSYEPHCAQASRSGSHPPPLMSFHRDLKPDNLLIDFNGNLKVDDHLHESCVHGNSHISCH